MGNGFQSPRGSDATEALCDYVERLERAIAELEEHNAQLFARCQSLETQIRELRELLEPAEEPMPRDNK